jgi:hypothetical protein
MGALLLSRLLGVEVRDGNNQPSLSFPSLLKFFFPLPDTDFSGAVALLFLRLPVGPFDPFFLCLIPRTCRKSLLFLLSRHFPAFSHLPLLSERER